MLRPMSPPTRERILDGAASAVARHGLAKLEMSDVSSSSGVSRGTLYRYFPSRDVLLDELARHQAHLFKKRVLRAIEEAPPGPARIQVALEHATRHVREHAGLQRMLETDPALVLGGLRRQFEGLKAEFGALLRPLLEESELVRARVVTADQLLDWTMRIMISGFLLPEKRPDDLAQGLTAVYRLLTAPVRGAGRDGARRARKPDEIGRAHV